jgi:hypothetical protein
MTEIVRPEGQILDAQLHLLDRQMLDSEGKPTSTADDVELAGAEWDEHIRPDSERPTIVALLSGPVVLNRIFGGRPPISQLYRIEWSSVTRIGSALELDVTAESLDVDWPERWVRDHIIARIPGGLHDPE